MKIISKYKDYYDYLTGIYGVDPLIVLDRRKFEKPDFHEPLKVQLFICGTLYEGWHEDGKYYFGEDLLSIAFEWKSPNKQWISSWHPRYRHITKGSEYVKMNTIAIESLPDSDALNKKAACPIIIRGQYSGYGHHGGSQFYHFPILRELGIVKMLPPKDIYLQLSAWLAPKDKVEDKRTNDEKIASRGFDKKTSFRNIK